MVERHEFFVGQSRVHHIVNDDDRTIEPVLIAICLLANVLFVFERVEEILDGVVADFDTGFHRQSAEVTGERRLAGAAFADDEQVLIVIDPSEFFQLLDLPADAAVEFLRQEFLAGQSAVVFQLDEMRFFAERDFLFEDTLEIGEVCFGTAGQINIASREIEQLQPFG